MSGTRQAMGALPRSLADWLAYLETRHPVTQIVLGLERVGTVAARMGLTRPRATVIAVGGTNGKGSCVAVIEGLLLALGKRVGAYTSPHLCRYNERVRVQGREASDDALCAAFAAAPATSRTPDRCRLRPRDHECRAAGHEPAHDSPARRVRAARRRFSRP